MSFLSKLSKPGQAPVQAVIAGEQGLGKTTLGAMLPKPILMRIEDGSAALGGQDIAMLELVKSSADVFEQIKELATLEHDFKTLVIDSLTAFDALVVGEVQKRNNTANLAACDGGFGGGFHSVRQEHERLRAYCDRLSREKGMNIIYIAHTETETVSPPDGAEFTRYTIQATRSKSVDCAKVYTNNCDLVAFIKLKTLVIDGRGKSDGSRIITCYPSAAHVSKNRFGIETDLPFSKDANPFNNIIKQLETK